MVEEVSVEQGGAELGGTKFHFSSLFLHGCSDAAVGGSGDRSPRGGMLVCMSCPGHVRPLVLSPSTAKYSIVTRFFRLCGFLCIQNDATSEMHFPVESDAFETALERGNPFVVLEPLKPEKRMSLLLSLSMVSCHR